MFGRMVAGKPATRDAASRRSALFRAVIEQAVYVAREKTGNLREAAAYFLTVSDDFEIVCEMAGLEPEYLRRRIKGKLEEKAAPVP